MTAIASHIKGPTAAVRASAALPAAGAFDASGVTLDAETAESLTLYVTYTPGASSTSGAPKFKLQASPDGATWYDLGAPNSIVTAGAVTLTTGVYTLGPAAADAVTPVLYATPPLDVRGCGWVRALFAEAGDTAHPGTVAAAGVVSVRTRT